MRFGDFGLHILDVQVAGQGVDVGEDRHCILVEDADDRAHIGDAGGDDLVTGIGVDDAHGRVDSRSARCHSLRMADAVHLGELPLKLIDLRTAQASPNGPRGSPRSVPLSLRRPYQIGAE